MIFRFNSSFQRETDLNIEVSLIPWMILAGTSKPSDQNKAKEFRMSLN